MSLFLLGCGGGESGGSSEPAAKTEGEEIADALNDAQDAAANVENVLEQGKVDIDTAVEAAEETDED